MKSRPFIISIIIILLYPGCNKQSTAIDYNSSIIREDIDGYSRDLQIKGDTLFVVSENDGLLIYKINENLEEGSITLDSIYANSKYFQNNSLDLVQIQYSHLLNSIIALDKFYSIQRTELSSLFNNIDFESISGFADNEHPSEFTINDYEEKCEIFSIIRNKSGQEGVLSDFVSIYKIDMIQQSNVILQDSPFKIIDSLNYDATDMHYVNNNLFISHTSSEEYEFRAYKRNNIDNLFVLDTVVTIPSDSTTSL